MKLHGGIISEKCNVINTRVFTAVYLNRIFFKLSSPQKVDRDPGNF
jgi:hypothetical protein